MLTWFRLCSRFKMSINSRSLGDMLLHLLGIFEDLQSFDRTFSKELDQITVLCDVHQGEVPGMCEHRFCSQTKTIRDRNCTACFSLANIFNQSTNKSFGAKLQSEVTGGFTQVRIGNLINQSATSCAISIPPLLEDCSEQKTFKDVARRWLR